MTGVINGQVNATTNIPHHSNSLSPTDSQLLIGLELLRDDWLEDVHKLQTEFTATNVPFTPEEDTEDLALGSAWFTLQHLEKHSGPHNYPKVWDGETDVHLETARTFVQSVFNAAVSAVPNSRLWDYLIQEQLIQDAVMAMWFVIFTQYVMVHRSDNDLMRELDVDCRKVLKGDTDVLVRLLGYAVVDMTCGETLTSILSSFKSMIMWYGVDVLEIPCVGLLSSSPFLRQLLFPNDNSEDLEDDDHLWEMTPVEYIPPNSIQ